MSWDMSPAVSREMGDSGPWVRQIRDAWQAAASDAIAPNLPRDPTNAYLKHLATARAPDLDAAQARLLAYWNPLLHLLMYGLGWARADVGLLRWRELGYPTTDPVLRVVAQWWNTERLEDFAAWATTSDRFEIMAGEIRRAAHAPATPVTYPEIPSALGLRTREPAWCRVWSTGSDLLHLRGHAMTPVGMHGFDVQGLEPVSHRDDAGHLVLFTRTYWNWYRHLAESGRASQGTVDVVCRPVGWLGTYRQSPNTELWHRSDEDTHILGN